MPTPQTMLDKIWDRHVVRRAPSEPDLLYIDLHLVHEVTSPQAFESLSIAGRRVRRPDRTLATIDHAVPTTPRDQGIDDPVSAKQIATLERNAAQHGVTLYGLAVSDLRRRMSSRRRLRGRRCWRLPVHHAGRLCGQLPGV